MDGSSHPPAVLPRRTSRGVSGAAPAGAGTSIAIEAPLGSLKGIGPARASALAKAGLATVEDLLLTLPYRYEDRSRAAALDRLVPGMRVSFRAVVGSTRLIRTRRRGFTIFEGRLDDGSATVGAVWYNRPYLHRSLVAGREAFFYGELRPPRNGKGEPRLENLEIEMWDAGAGHDPIHTGRVTPVYEKIGPLNSRMIRALVHRALEGLGAFGEVEQVAGDHSQPLEAKLLSDRSEFLPEAILRRHDLPGRLEALRGVHFPPDRPPQDPGLGVTAPPPPAVGFDAPTLRPELADTESEAGLTVRSGVWAVCGSDGRGATGDVPGASEAERMAWLSALDRRGTAWHRRLVFEEFFLFQAGVALRRAERAAAQRGFVYRTSPEMRRRLRSILPFRLTEGQRTSFAEIVGDLRSPRPMNRLLQGEVGCGKTLVAALTMAFAAENGVQSALMVPTEILAGQHAGTLGKLLAPLGHRIVLLTGSVVGRARASALASLASGEAAIVVGTHALARTPVHFRRLGLVVIDEQHRFGVRERATLRARGSGGAGPDTLVVTATPIPRTLALTLYGDLELSMIEDLPGGRGAMRTILAGEKDRASVYEGVRLEVERGRQAFIVLPLVEEREGSERRAAKAMAADLAQGVFRGRAVGLIHGRMTGEEKDGVMASFRDGRISVLVATTVIEVGIDVPNATILVVEHADRFGLGQLHQLRGRVGRGGEDSTCVLIASAGATEAARARLAAVERESSGFRLAEADLAIRGAGEMTGTRQSGLPEFRIGDLARDREIMDAARREAFAFIADERASASGLGTNSSALRAVLARMRPAWRDRLGLADVG